MVKSRKDLDGLTRRIRRGSAIDDIMFAKRRDLQIAPLREPLESSTTELPFEIKARALYAFTIQKGAAACE